MITLLMSQIRFASICCRYHFFRGIAIAAKMLYTDYYYYALGGRCCQRAKSGAYVYTRCALGALLRRATPAAAPFIAEAA